MEIEYVHRQGGNVLVCLRCYCWLKGTSFIYLVFFGEREVWIRIRSVKQRACCDDCGWCTCGTEERKGRSISCFYGRVFSTFRIYLPTYLFQYRPLTRPCKSQLDPPHGSYLPPVPLFLRFLFNDRRRSAMDLRLDLIRERRCD